MNYIVLLQILFFYGYVAYVWFRIGVQKSISNSWYTLPDKKELFFVFAAGTGLPMWAYSICGFNDYSQFLFAISGFFMTCVGIASMFKSSNLVKYIHYGATVVAIAFAFWAIYAQSQDYYAFLIMLVGILPLLFVKNKIWWIEIWIFAVVILKILFL